MVQILHIILDFVLLSETRFSKEISFTKIFIYLPRFKIHNLFKK